MDAVKTVMSARAGIVSWNLTTSLARCALYGGMMKYRISTILMYIGVAFLYLPIFVPFVTVYGINLPHPWMLFGCVFFVGLGGFVSLQEWFWQDNTEA